MRARYTTDDAKELLEHFDVKAGTLFELHASRFAALAERIDGLIVKHIVREVAHELKPYLARCVHLV